MASTVPPLDANTFQTYEQAQTANGIKAQVDFGTNRLFDAAERNTIALRQALSAEALNGVNVIQRNSDLVREGAERNSVAGILNSNRTSDLIREGAERNSVAGILNTNRGTDLIRSDAAANSAASLLQTQNVGIGLRDAVERNATAGVLATQNNTGIVREAVERGATASVLATTNAISTIERIGATGVLQAERTAADIRTLLGTQHAVSIENYKEQLVQQATHAGNLRAEILRTENALGRQASDNVTKMQFDLLKLENSLGRQADANAAALSLAGAQQSATTLLKMAEFASGIKDKIGEKGDCTNALINSKWSEDKLLDLNKLNTENTVLKEFPYGHHHGYRHGRHGYGYDDDDGQRIRISNYQGGYRDDRRPRRRGDRDNDRGDDRED